LKYCVYQYTIKIDGEERVCDEKTSASVGNTPKAQNALIRTSNLERRLGRLHSEILKLVQEKD